MGVSMICTFLVPIYIAAGVCASEASGGTLAFLQATPVDRAKWALAKLAMGLFTVIAPLLMLLFLTMVLIVFGVDFRSLPESFAFESGSIHYFGFLTWAIVWAILSPTSMFIWSLAVGVNRSRELWAIACSLGVFVVLWISFGYGLDKVPAIRPLLEFAFPAIPGGIAIATSGQQQLLPTLLMLLVALVSHGGLLAWFLTQYGRSTRHAGHSPKAVVVQDPESVVICEPRKSTTSAILWMQMQEIAPLAVACVAIILLPALLLANFENGWFGHTYTERLGEGLSGLTGIMGFLFATLIGVGVFLRDLEPGLNTFWRSRPTSANQWFWTKYVSAIAMLAMALSIPAMLAIYLNLEDIQLDRESIANVVLVVPVFLSSYCVAVATTALLRHVIYGCMLSMGIVLIPFVIYVETLDSNHWSAEVRWGVLLAMQIVLIVVATLVAWLAVTRDWGWKQ